MLVAGKRCPSTPNVCSECCADTDCPNAATGQKCVSGVCSAFGCTLRTCWQGNDKLLCKIDGTGCAVSSELGFLCQQRSGR